MLVGLIHFLMKASELNIKAKWLKMLYVFGYYFYLSIIIRQK